MVYLMQPQPRIERNNIPTHHYPSSLDSVPFFNLVIHRQITPQSLFHRRAPVLGQHQSLVHRLAVYSTLEGHSGCVNTLSWNATGTLLASGSDDTQVRLWKYPGTGKNSTTEPQHVIDTEHFQNIFGVCFLPGTDDNIIATGAMDCDVRIHDVTAQSSRCLAFHRGRVKEVQSSLALPHLFWSAGEDGIIGQFDLRDLPTPPSDDRLRSSRGSFDTLGHVGTSSSGILVRLGNNPSPVRAMSMSIHPLDPHIFAIACGDQYIRIFDRRLIRKDSEEGVADVPLLKFTPPHLQGKARNRRPQHGTSVQFSADGRELVASYHQDHIYLFDYAMALANQDSGLQEKMVYPHPGAIPVTKFEHTEEIESALSNFQQQGNANFAAKKWSKAIRLYSHAIDWMKHYRGLLAEDASSTSSASSAIHSIGTALYNNRSQALLKRQWIGDVYCAYQDATYVTTHLNPDNRKAYNRQLRCCQHLNQVEQVSKLVEQYKTRFPAYPQDMSPFEKYLEAKSSVKEDQHSSEEDERRHDDSEEDEDLEEEEKEKEENDQLHLISTDVLQRYIGYCNVQTDIKEATFFGTQTIVSGSDDGRIFCWDKRSGNLIRCFEADEDIVNCVQPHPSAACLASSGIENVIRLWEPISDDTQEDLEQSSSEAWLDDIVEHNQQRMNQEENGSPFLDGRLQARLMQRFLNQADPSSECIQS